jgi:hypothetical protein
MGPGGIEPWGLVEARSTVDFSPLGRLDRRRCESISRHEPVLRKKDR